MGKKSVQITCEIEEYDSIADLKDADQELLNAAKAIATEAYAPYSNFNVGAALRLTNGTIVTGSNQENIAYNSGLCAERVAIFAAGANHAGVPIESIAITAISDEVHLAEPLSPCGSCRQVIAEYESRYAQDIRIIMSGVEGKVQVVKSVKELLPLVFFSEGVKRGR